MEHNSGVRLFMTTHKHGHFFADYLFITNSEGVTLFLESKVYYVTIQNLNVYTLGPLIQEKSNERSFELS